MSKSAGRNNFDHIKDYRYIYPSFKSVFGVDINNDELTWWEYTMMLEACFMSDCMISNVIKYREMKIPTKGTQEERERIGNLKHKYMLRTSDNGIGNMFKSLKGAINE